MGAIKKAIAERVKKTAGKGADKVAMLSSLSPSQLEEIATKRAVYLEYETPDDPAQIEVAERLLAASSIKIYNAHLPQISELYLPARMHDDVNAKGANPQYNIRYINITKWVSDKKENSLEKLVNVYGVLSDEPVNIALIFNRTVTTTNVYLAVSNAYDKDSNADIDSYIRRLQDAIKGNFPGSEWSSVVGKGTLPVFNERTKYSIASVSNIPTEKSEKFKSQTIEKLLDGTVPENSKKEYTLILLATPIKDIDERKNILSELYSGLTPYASWQTNYTFTESDATGSMAIFGVNAGVSAGIQNTVSNSNADMVGETNNNSCTRNRNDSTTDTISEQRTLADNKSNILTDTQSRTVGVSNGYSKMRNWAVSNSAGSAQTLTAGEISTEGSSVTGAVTVSAGMDNIPVLGLVIDDASFSAATSAFDSTGESYSVADAVSRMSQSSRGYSVGRNLVESVGSTVSKSVAQQVGESVSNSVGNSTGKTIGRSIASTIGKAVNTALTVTEGVAKGTNLGANFGANFARSSNVTINVGKNEGVTQSFVNFNVKHALDILDAQIRRYDQSSALGMWDFAAYVISEDYDVSSNVAHTYLSLTQGEESYLSNAAINTWRGDLAEENDEFAESESAKVICDYLRELKHPVFFLNPYVTALQNHYYVYPPVVTPTTGLSGKELAYSLNFPNRSVSGFPILECAEFGRNIVTYDDINKNSDKLKIGKIFHMNHEERVDVELTKDSLSSHVFITGSTGSGKSNTIYRIINEAETTGTKYLVIEPAKGEYKRILSGSNVSVYGTNPSIMPLLRINPFSFPRGIHVLEHLDRLVEIFNVCWPMYAAMPAVLKSAIEKSYEDCGWDLVSSKNKYSDQLFPSFSDVARNIKIIIDSSEYDNENKGAYKGSLLTRLQSLSNGINGLIFNQNELSNEALFDENVIVDISRVGSNETKSLIMGMLVLKLQEYRMVSSEVVNSSLKHITILEEAHNILKKTSVSDSVAGASIVGKSVEMLANAIAEMRTYGEGFIIADQAPGLMDMSVIRNTNTKIIMRLPDLADRELVGKAANLDEDQIAELAKLPRGVAAIYQNEWIQPVLCKVDKHSPSDTGFSYSPNSSDDNNLTDYAKRIEIADLLSKGMTVDKETCIRDIKPILDEIDLDASIQVAILDLLVSPPKEPRMTKLAPIMNAMFTDVTSAVSLMYSESKREEDWTLAAENKLKELYAGEIPVQTRRDIIQGIMTYYFYSELKNKVILENWANRGGLK